MVALERALPAKQRFNPCAPTIRTESLSFQVDLMIRALNLNKVESQHYENNASIRATEKED
jgi:hypothetical protein